MLSLPRLPKAQRQNREATWAINVHAKEKGTASSKTKYSSGACVSGSSVCIMCAGVLLACALSRVRSLCSAICCARVRSGVLGVVLAGGGGGANVMFGLVLVCSQLLCSCQFAPLFSIMACCLSCVIMCASPFPSVSSALFVCCCCSSLCSTS